MAMSRSIASYTDVHQVMKTALMHEALVYECVNEKRATYFRMRCNYYRKLLIENLEKRSPESVPSTPFDRIIIRLNPRNKAQLIFTQEAKIEGKLTTPDGESVNPSGETPHDYLEAATPHAVADKKDNLELDAMALVGRIERGEFTDEE
jgi:hypothetical protein